MLTGGGRPADVDEKGLFIAPTIFTDVSDSMEIWNEEIFGPVLCVMECESMDDAISKANKSKYGLGGAVLTKNAELKDKAVKGLRCGIVWVDCSQPCFCQLPWGGLKRSGYGRDLGPDGLKKYCNVKSVVTYESGDTWTWYNPESA